MRLFDGKVAIIAGSTKGNRLAMANLFSEHGANVVITGRDKKEVQSVVSDISKENKTDPIGLKVDLTYDQEVREMVARALQKYNQIDILINVHVFQSEMSCRIFPLKNP